MEKQKTAKDILIEIVMTECDTKNIMQLDEENMSEDEISDRVSMVLEIYKFTIKFFENRFIKELKQYNNDEKKAYDEFICRRNLELFRFHIEEILPLQFDMGSLRVPGYIYYTKIKYFRNLHNCLCNEFNNTLKIIYNEGGVL